jgi:hypothetical protein
MKILIFILFVIFLSSCFSGSTASKTTATNDTTSYAGRAWFRCTDGYPNRDGTPHLVAVDTTYLDTIQVIKVRQDSIGFFVRENTTCRFSNGLEQRYIDFEANNDNKYIYKSNSRYMDLDVQFIFYGDSLKAKDFWSSNSNGSGSEYLFKGKKM